MAICAITFTACDNRPPAPKDDGRTAEASEEATDPTNTEVNVRDRNNNNLTPFSQSENSADREITRNIRRNIVNEDNLSTNAKNIKIITIDGVVTLRGPINNDQEKRMIIQIARSQDGVKQLRDQLEVDYSRNQNRNSYRDQQRNY